MGLFEESGSVPVGEISDCFVEGQRKIDYSLCEGCPLHGNTKVLTWRGDCRSSLCFVGMNPGAQEKKFGLPFVGPAGGELDRVVLGERGLGIGETPERFESQTIFTEGDFYLTNIVKCWTANNLDPPWEAIDHCWAHLKPELEGRRIIVPLGALAQKTLRSFYNGPAEIFPMIHPAAALRRGLHKAKLMRDTRKLRERLTDAT